MNASKALKNKGFSLIESLISLLIIGIALSSLIGSYEQNTRYLSYAKDKVLSGIVINNLIVGRRLHPEFVKGNIELGNKTWYWRSVVTKFEIEDMLQVQLEVFASKADKKAKKAIQSQKFYVQE